MAGKVTAYLWPPRARHSLQITFGVVPLWCALVIRLASLLNAPTNLGEAVAGISLVYSLALWFHTFELQEAQAVAVAFLPVWVILTGITFEFWFLVLGGPSPFNL